MPDRFKTLTATYVYNDANGLLINEQTKDQAPFLIREVVATMVELGITSLIFTCENNTGSTVHDSVRWFK